VADQGIVQTVAVLEAAVVGVVLEIVQIVVAAAEEAAAAEVVLVAAAVLETGQTLVAPVEKEREMPVAVARIQN